MAWGKAESLKEADFAGLRTADKLTDASTIGYYWREQLGITIDTTVGACLSVYVEKDAIEYRRVCLSLLFWGDTTDQLRVEFSTKTGEATILLGIPTITVTDVGTHWRIAVGFKPSDSTNDVLDILIWPAVFNSSPLITGSAFFSNAQLNNGILPQAYIKTTTGQITDAIQNLLLWSEEFDKWGEAFGVEGSTEINVGSAPATERSWSASQLLTRAWETSCTVLGTHAIAGVGVAGCMVAGYVPTTWSEEVTL